MYNQERFTEVDIPQIANLMGPTWGPPGSCRLSGTVCCSMVIIKICRNIISKGQVGEMPIFVIRLRIVVYWFYDINHKRQSWVLHSLTNFWNIGIYCLSKYTLPRAEKWTGVDVMNCEVLLVTVIAIMIYLTYATIHMKYNHIILQKCHCPLSKRIVCSVPWH